MKKIRLAWAWFCLVCEVLMWPIRLIFTPLLYMFAAMGLMSALRRREDLRRHWVVLGLLVLGQASHVFAGVRGTTPVGNWTTWLSTMLQGDYAWGLGMVMLTGAAVGWYFTRGQGENGGSEGLHKLFTLGVALGVLFHAADFFIPLMGFSADLPTIEWSDVFPGELPSCRHAS